MMLVNFQTLLTYEQTKWLLSNWNGYDIAVNISPIMKRSVVIYQNNFYKYNGDIRIWEELDLTEGTRGTGGTLEIIILRFFGDSLSQWRKIIDGQLFDDPELMEDHEDEIRKIYESKLPATKLMLATVKSGITVEPEIDLTRMHFVNGSFKIEEGEFRNLEQGGRVEEDYIMNCISYPFHISGKEAELQQGFHTMMEQIFPEPGALQYIYLTFVRAILGEQTNHFMYLYGSGKELSSIYNSFSTNNTFFFIIYRI